MPLKAEDLHSFEAYKKAMRAAAGQIGKNTPFCIYTDVQLPDASKKMHVLKPFVVVGSPVALIAPWLKTLQGTKTLTASGTCFLHNGRISLAPNKGKVNYGQIKTQGTTIKDLFGKEILVPAEDEDTAAAAPAAMPASPPTKPPAPTAARTTPPSVPPRPAQGADYEAKQDNWKERPRGLPKRTRELTRGAQAREQVNMDSVAKEKKIDRIKFGRYVEAWKKGVQKEGGYECGWNELLQIADQYIKEGGKKSQG